MSLTWDLTCVAGSAVDADGFLVVQPLPLGANDNGSAIAAEVHNPYGLNARPLDPDVDANGAVGKGCTVLVGHEQNTEHCFLGSDPRITPSLPPLPKGGCILYGATSDTDATKPAAFLFFDSAKKGASMWLVPHADASPAASSIIAIDTSTPGAEQIAIRHGAGMGISMFAGGKNPLVMNNKAGTAQVMIDDDGVTIAGPKIAINGAVLLGDPVAATPLAMGVPLSALLTQLCTIVAGLPGGSAAAALVAQLSTILSTKAYAT